MRRLLVVLALLALGACEAPGPGGSQAPQVAAATRVRPPAVDEYVGAYDANGLRTGQGTYRWADGRIYVGPFRNGLPNGRGTYTLANGEKYVGDFQDNRRTQGTYTWPDGRQYVGGFRGDRPDGSGTYTWPDGKKYVGDFREGRLEGNGTLSWPDGREYAGEMRGDMPNGHGTMRLADGRQQTGTFRNGDYLGGTTRAADAVPAAAGGSGEVPLEQRGGTFLVPAVLNDSVPLDFYLDSGAADVSVPLAAFEQMKRAGTVRAEDVIGSETYLMANGASNRATIFTIRTLKLGSVVLRNVRASVSDRTGPALLGMSFLARFASWTVDNTRNVLILR